MPRLFILRDSIRIHAPIVRCFQLSTDVGIVARELHMRPIRGRTSGHVTNGDTILWKGWKFGLPQFHESLIEAFDPPCFFRDRMIAGRFATFEHDHRFESQLDGKTLLQDEIRFSMPFGFPGRIVGRLLMMPYARNVLRRRFLTLKRLAENEE